MSNATQGFWCISSSGDIYSEKGVVAISVTDEHGAELIEWSTNADKVFIQTALVDVQELVAEVDRLKKERDMWEAEAESWKFNDED